MRAHEIQINHFLIPRASTGVEHLLRHAPGRLLVLEVVYFVIQLLCGP